MTSFETLVQKWAESTSRNADGGGANIDMNGDDDLFKKLGITKLSYELIDCKPEEYEPARTSQSTIRILTNDNNFEITQTVTVESGITHSTQTSVTNGFKVSAKAGLKIAVASMEISVEVNTSKTETTEEKKDEKITDSVEMKIPPKTKIANYLWSTNQIVRFTSTLRVSGQVGVYFQKEICNAYGDGDKEKHYKWYPDAAHIVKWAIKEGYANWFIDDEGYGCFKISGKSEVAVREFIIGEAEPL